MSAVYGRYVPQPVITVPRRPGAGPPPGHDRREWCRRRSAALLAPHAAITGASGSSVRFLWARSLCALRRCTLQPAIITARVCLERTTISCQTSHLKYRHCRWHRAGRGRGCEFAAPGRVGGACTIGGLAVRGWSTHGGSGGDSLCAGGRLTVGQAGTRCARVVDSRWVRRGLPVRGWSTHCGGRTANGRLGVGGRSTRRGRAVDSAWAGGRLGVGGRSTRRGRTVDSAWAGGRHAV